jgi:transposase InsO family protein
MELVTPSGKVVTAFHHHGLYMLKSATSIIAYGAASQTESRLMQLHCQLGHLGVDSIIKAVKEKQIAGVPSLSAEDMSEQQQSIVRGCVHCIMGKGHRVSWGHKGLHRASQPFEVVHADLVGPIHNQGAVMSIAGRFVYFLTLVDDYSGLIWIRPLVSKSDTTAAIIDWHNQTMLMMDKKLKEFHSDNGTEFVNKELKRYFAEQGTRMTQQPKESPQLNAIAERANRTVLEAAKAMVSGANLPKSFWPFAVRAAAQVLNRTHIKKRTGKTAYEAFTGKKPDISHLHVFGCDAYFFLHRNERQKMGNKMREAIYLGFDVEHHCDMLWDIHNRKMVLSRDVRYKDRQFLHAAQVSGVREDVTIVEVDDMCYPPIEEEDESRDEKSERAVQHQVQHQEEQSTAGRVPTIVSDLPPDDLSSSSSSPPPRTPPLLTSLHPNFTIREPYKVPTFSPQRTFPDSSSDDSSNRRSTRERKRVDRGAFVSHYTRSSSDSHQGGEGKQEENAEQHHYAFHTACLMRAAMPDPPLTLAEAKQRPDKDKWIGAAQGEIKSIHDNQVWRLVPRPFNIKVIGNKWVFNYKTSEEGEIARWKARLVALGYAQEEGVNYFEVFAPTLKYRTFRLFLSIVAGFDMELDQMDVDTAFLNGIMDTEVYMEQPEGFEEGDSDQVCLLVKALYGTHQAPRVWNDHINTTITSVLGYERCKSDACMYVKISRSGKPMYLTLFVDDIQSAYFKQDEEEWKELKATFCQTYKMKDIGESKWILGMRIVRDRCARTLTLDQAQYCEKALARFNMQNCKSVATPGDHTDHVNDRPADASSNDEPITKQLFQKLVGTLLYASLSTRPDITHAVHQLSKHVEAPTAEHWMAGKRVLRYLRGTTNAALVFRGVNSQEMTLEAFADADHANDRADRKSVSGVLIKLNGDVVMWLTRKQSLIAASTTDAEYMAMAVAVQELKWMRMLLIQMKLTVKPQSVLHCDNQSAIVLSKEEANHDRTKHIDVKYHIVREAVFNDIVDVQYIRSDEQQADILTKALQAQAFVRIRDQIMVVHPQVQYQSTTQHAMTQRAQHTYAAVHVIKQQEEVKEEDQDGVEQDVERSQSQE